HLHYSFLCNQTPATNLYTLSLHDALPISRRMSKTGWALASFAGIAAWFAATVYAAASNPDPSDATPVLRTFAGGGAVFCAAVLIGAGWEVRSGQRRGATDLYRRLALWQVPQQVLRAARQGTGGVAYTYLVLCGLATGLFFAG